MSCIYHPFQTESKQYHRFTVCKATAEYGCFAKSAALHCDRQLIPVGDMSTDKSCSPQTGSPQPATPNPVTSPPQPIPVVTPGPGAAEAGNANPNQLLSNRQQTATATRKTGMALYEDEKKDQPLLTAALSTFVIAGPDDRDRVNVQKKKANLGVIIGVYLPTIQNVFGVLMFLRLLWIVGIAGVGQGLILVGSCCMCTFLTSLSMSAIATNGVLESGGSYFMISRNLGPEFGCAIGLLFYMANTVAVAMYLVGGVELMLLYMAPDMTLFGEMKEVRNDIGFGGRLTNNFRIYATLLLVIETILVAIGVKFVQLFAPISLLCVITSVIAIYAGAIEKSVTDYAGTNLCMLGPVLLQSVAVLKPGAALENVCNYCNKNESSPIYKFYCPSGNGSCSEFWNNNEFLCEPGITGFDSNTLSDNWGGTYMNFEQAVPDRDDPKHKHKTIIKAEVYQDITTTYFVLLAIYFPSVTGIMTGSNMSGDLKDPAKSIPVGTIAAQLTTSFVYMSLVVIFGASIKGPLLRDKYGYSIGGRMVTANLAWPHQWLLLIGSFTSTFGAGLQSLCSAPRLLQSIAKDDVIPLLRPFGKVNRWNEPWNGLWITVFIAEICILIGLLDYIAPIVNFFFLMCYAFLNITCALHSIMGAPNWRPRFKYYHWAPAVAGASLSFFIMFSTYWYYGLVVCGLALAIYKYVQYKGAKKEWGDGMRGLALTTAQYSLLKLEDKDDHPKNWRPQFLVLTKMQANEMTEGVRVVHKLLDLTCQLKAGKGLTLVSTLLAGNPSNPENLEEARQIKKRIQTVMTESKLQGFAKCVIYEESQMAGSVSTLIQSAGIGPLRPNTVMIGWPKNWSTLTIRGANDTQSQYWAFLDKINRVAELNMCLIIPKGLDSFPDQDARLKGHIDIWWVLQDGGLLLLLGFLLKQHRVWRQCTVRLFAVAQKTDDSAKMKEDLTKMLYHLRIDADVNIVEFSDPEVSIYAYERTEKMEERAKLIDELHLTDKQKQNLPQVVMENVHNSPAMPPASPPNQQVKGDNTPEASPFDEDLQESTTSIDSDKKVRKTGGGSVDLGAVESASNTSKSSPSVQAPDAVLSRTASYVHLDKGKVKKMHTAVQLNQKIRERSGDAQLVVLNLPRPPTTRKGLFHYFEYLDALTEQLSRVLLVRGCGKEVITIVS